VDFARGRSHSMRRFTVRFERDIAEEVDESDCKTDRRRNPPECGTESLTVTRASAYDRFSPILLSSHENGGNPILDPDLTDHQGVFVVTGVVTNGPQLSDGISNENGESATRKASNQPSPRAQSGYRVPASLVRALDATSTPSRLVAGVVANVASLASVLVTGRKSRFDPVSRGVTPRRSRRPRRSPHACRSPDQG